MRRARGHGSGREKFWSGKSPGPAALRLYFWRGAQVCRPRAPREGLIYGATQKRRRSGPKTVANPYAPRSRSLRDVESACPLSVAWGLSRCESLQRENLGRGALLSLPSPPFFFLRQGANLEESMQLVFPVTPRIAVVYSHRPIPGHGLSENCPVGLICKICSPVKEYPWAEQRGVAE